MIIILYNQSEISSITHQTLMMDFSKWFKKLYGPQRDRVKNIQVDKKLSLLNLTSSKSLLLNLIYFFS